MVYIGPGQVFSPFGVVPQGHSKNFGAQKSEYLESGKSQCNVSTRA